MGNHTHSFRETLCFSSYINRKLKIKLWWIGAGERKERAFCTVYFVQSNFFMICVLSKFIVYWIHFENIHTFPYQKTPLRIHVCCLFLKSSKVISTSLSKGLKVTIEKNLGSQNLDFLSFKNLSPVQFWRSSNSHRYYWIFKLLVAT